MKDNHNIVHRMAASPFRMKLFMMKHMPMGWIAGLKIVSFDESKAQVSVRYKFLNKNPFRSVYFAVLSMAAELSSGILALSATHNANVPVSMLVLKMKADFLKKARTSIVFTCDDGKKIDEMVARSIETGEGQTVEVSSTGVDAAGDKVAEFTFTWTFKPKG